LDETVERYWRRKVVAILHLEIFERQPARGIRNLRRGPVGTQKHAFGHGIRPERHGIAKNANIQPFDLF